MKFEIYCAGLSRDEGQISQIGGCGIVLLATDGQRRVQCREFAFGLGSSSQMLADVQAARLALASIVPAMRVHRCFLFIDSQDVANFLTSPATVLGIREQVAELKRWYGYYKDVSVNLLSAIHPRFERAKELAKQGLDSQAPYDSGTFAISEVVK